MSSREKWAVDNTESSDDADDSKQEKKVQYNTGWVKPPLPRAGGLFGAYNQRKIFEMSVHPPQPLEQLMGQIEQKTNKGNDKEKKKNDKNEDKNVASRNNAASVQAVEVEANATTESDFEPIVAKGENRVSDEAFETRATSQSAPESTPEAFEPIDTSHADEGKPVIPLNANENEAFGKIPTELYPQLDSLAADDDKPKFEDGLNREMPPGPTGIMSGDMLDQSSTGQRESSPLAWGAPDARPSSSSAAGGDAPRAWPVSDASPWRPSPSPGAFEADSYGVSGPVAAPDRRFATSPGDIAGGVTATIEVSKAITSSAEMASNRNRFVVRNLTRVALEGFLEQRKRERYSNEPLLHRQRDEILRLQDQQRQANERLNTLLKKQEEQVSDEQVIFDQNGNKIVLQPGWRVERSAGGYSVVVDKHNRVVHDAIRYGEAFKHDQQREQIGDDAFTALQSKGSGGGAQDDGGAAVPLPPVSITTGQTTQTTSPQQLLDRPNLADFDHRLPAPRKSLREAALNPWLWTAVAVLIIIYFVASLA